MWAELDWISNGCFTKCWLFVSFLVKRQCGTPLFLDLYFNSEILTKKRSPKTEDSVIMYSPSWRSKPVWFSASCGKQKKIIGILQRHYTTQTKSHLMRKHGSIWICTKWFLRKAWRSALKPNHQHKQIVRKCTNDFLSIHVSHQFTKNIQYSWIAMRVCWTKYKNDENSNELTLHM